MDATFHAERQRGIGGSDSPIILGCSPYKTVTDLYHEKRGERPQTPTTPDMQRGTALEPIIADLYAERTGHVLQAEGFVSHPRYSWMIGHIDRLQTDDPAVIEIKCPRISKWLKCKREGVSQDWIVQLQHYLEIYHALHGIEKGIFLIFSAEFWDLLIVEVQRDPELCGLIIKEDERFWSCVQNRIPPAVPGNGIAFQEPSDTILTISGPDVERTISSYFEAKAIIADAEALKEEEEVKIKALLPSYGMAELPGKARIHWKMGDGRQTTDWERFKLDHPDIDLTTYAKHGKPAEYFRVYPMQGV